MYIANSGPRFVIAGSEAMVSGTPISLAAGIELRVTGSSTQSLVIAVGITNVPSINFTRSRYVANVGSFVIVRQTFNPGSLITIQGMTLSPDQATTALVVGGNSAQEESTYTVDSEL